MSKESLRSNMGQPCYSHYATKVRAGNIACPYQYTSRLQWRSHNQTLYIVPRFLNILYVFYAALPFPFIIELTAYYHS